MWKEKEFAENLWESVRKYPIVWLIGGFLLVLFVIDIFWCWEYGFWEWVIAEHVDKEKAAVSRNRGGAVLAIIGLAFLAWGRLNLHRQTEYEKKQVELSEKTSLHERYEKAARMLSDEVMSVRIAGCRALAALARDDKDMLSPCSRLLFSYIKEPYFAEGQDDKKEEMAKVIGDFGTLAELRADIQEAINSVSDIYEYAYEQNVSLNDKIISLPLYFWQNKEKGFVCLAHGNFDKLNIEKIELSGANLAHVNLNEANLPFANFMRANLEHAKLYFVNLPDAIFMNANLKNAKFDQAKLQRADFKHANLENANFSGADLRHAKFYNANLKNANLNVANITSAELRHAVEVAKEEILLAEWSSGEGEFDGPPSLPDELMKDMNIVKWLTMPDWEWKNGENHPNEEKREWRSEHGFLHRGGLKT